MSSNLLTDSHAHLTSDAIIDLPGMLSRAKSAGVSCICNICTDIEELERGIVLAKEQPWIYNIGATTPHDVATQGEAHFARFAEAAKKGEIVAVGETGLDYFYAHSPVPLQKEFFIRYMNLALETDLPIVIHCRDAFADLFAMLDENFSESKRRGVLHCFTGTIEEANEVIKRGFYLSLSGIVTYKKSEALREVAKCVPLDRLLIETDTPYLAPQSKRGKQNEPAFLRETAEFIASLRSLPIEELASIASKNAKRIFCLH